MAGGQSHMLTNLCSLSEDQHEGEDSAMMLASSTKPERQRDDIGNQEDRRHTTK
jgi:hypothetical protein